jgi:dolichol-phosphate mannosyltransferase
MANRHRVAAMKGLIVVVNYEQGLEIGSFLTRLQADNPGLAVIVVDDASRDRSPIIAEGLGFRVIRRTENRGVGAAIRTGIQYARNTGEYEFVVIMSSNGKMRPNELPRVVAPILSDEADYVQGSRFVAEGRALQLSAFRGLAIPLYSLLASGVLRRRFTDITCGFRAYRLSLFNDPRVRLDQDWLDQYETELYIHYYACRLGLRIVEVPVTIDYSHLGPGRKSKIRPGSGWWSLFRPLFLLVLGLRR